MRFVSMNITHINTRAILDSRGNPTVEAEVSCNSGLGQAAIPSGASTSSHEANEVRDGGTDWGAEGVDKAVANVVNKIADALMGFLPMINSGLTKR